MIKLSERASLALHSLALIALGGGKLTSSGRIAAATGSSQAHLAKVLPRLVRAGLLISVRGPGGGFRLGRRPRQISLLQIYEAVEGPLEPPGCPLNRAQCPLAISDCPLTGLMADLSSRAHAFLSGNTLADLLSARTKESAR